MIAGGILAAPSIAGFVVFFAAPFLISLYYCFTEGITGTRFAGFNNFKSLLESNSFRLAAINTLKFNFISVPVIMVLSLSIALLLNSNIKFISVFKSLIILPLVIPVASVIYVWQILFGEYGTVNGFLVLCGLQPVDWLNSGWSFFILVSLYVWKNCGYNIILFIAGLNDIPVEYYEAAGIDGAGWVKCLMKITLPRIIPVGFFVFIISIINSFKVFREAYLLAGSYPYQDIYMLQHFMNNNFESLNYQRLSTAAFLVVIQIVLLVFFLFRFEERYGMDIRIRGRKSYD